jgi:hypothetical protein
MGDDDLDLLHVGHCHRGGPPTSSGLCRPAVLRLLDGGC